MAEPAAVSFRMSRREMSFIGVSFMRKGKLRL